MTVLMLEVIMCVGVRGFQDERDIQRGRKKYVSPFFIYWYFHSPTSPVFPNYVLERLKGLNY